MTTSFLNVISSPLFLSLYRHHHIIRQYHITSSPQVSHCNPLDIISLLMPSPSYHQAISYRHHKFLIVISSSLFLSSCGHHHIIRPYHIVITSFSLLSPRHYFSLHAVAIISSRHIISHRHHKFLIVISSSLFLSPCRHQHIIRPNHITSSPRVSHCNLAITSLLMPSPSYHQAISYHIVTTSFSL